MRKQLVAKWITFVLVWIVGVLLYAMVDSLESAWRFLHSWIPTDPERTDFASDVSFVVAFGLAAWYIAEWIIKNKFFAGGNS